MADIDQVVNTVIICIFILSVISNVIIKKFALKYSKHILFLWTSAVDMINVMTLIFMIATAISLSVNVVIITKYPRWFSLLSVVLNTTLPMTTTQTMQRYSIAFSVSMLPPMIFIISDIISSETAVIQNATFVAVCIVYATVYGILLLKFHTIPVYAYTAMTTILLVSEVVDYASSQYINIIWVLFPFVVLSVMFHTLIQVRWRNVTYVSYIDRSLIYVNRRTMEGIYDGKKVSLTMSKNITYDVKRLQTMNSSTDRIITCYGFTIDLPHSYIVTECGKYSLVEFRSRLRTAVRHPIVNLIYLSDCALILQAIHDFQSHARTFLQFTLSDLMYSDTGIIKLKYLSYGKEITHYTAPEIIDGANDDSQKSDVYSLGVVFWELLHPNKQFEITWNRNIAYVEFDDYPDALKDLVFKMLSRRLESRPSVCDVTHDINTIIYECFGDILSLIRIDLKQTFLGSDLLDLLVKKEIGINRIECGRICQMFLTNMLIRVVHSDLFSVHFDVEELDFSEENEYTTSPPTLESCGSHWSERGSSFMMAVTPVRERANSVEF